MNQYQTEKRLCTIYSMIVALATISSVCCGISWNHWKLVLDACPLNCGCILYGRKASVFEGGPLSACLWAVFGPLPVIAVALVMGGYHFIRVCINNTGKYENSEIVHQREGEMVMVATRSEVKNNSSIAYCWIPSSVFSCIFSVYCLVYAAIITDGYYKTCNQYKGTLIELIRANGNQVTAIHSRIGCQAVLDFMDYLQPDFHDRRRGEIINTGLALQMAIGCAWIMFILWVVASVITIIRAHKEKNVYTCCGN